MGRCVWSFVACAFWLPLAAQAGLINDERDHPWVAEYDLTTTAFSDAFRAYRGDQYIITDIDGYDGADSTLYSMVWRDNVERRGWAEHRDMSEKQYAQLANKYVNGEGYRLLDYEMYELEGELKFAAIWIENDEGIEWQLSMPQQLRGHIGTTNRLSRTGWRMVDIEVLPVKGRELYAALWHRNKEESAWHVEWDLTRGEYQEAVNRGVRLNDLAVVDYESYMTAAGQRYAAVWAPRAGRAWFLRTNRNLRQFEEFDRQYRDEGLRLIDFERTNTPAGARYSGIWVENDRRFRQPWKRDVDKLVQEYQQAHSMPSISVVVIRDGEQLYRRGFGISDPDTKRPSHSGTVYFTASVSKALGGTLAVLLENAGRLRDGTRFNLNLSRRTSTYLTNRPVQDNRGRTTTLSIPAHHTHTLMDIMAHRACLPYYKDEVETVTATRTVKTYTTPHINDLTTHYSRALFAAADLWTLPLIVSVRVVQSLDANGQPTGPKMVTRTPCQVGVTSDYSTAGFTYLAAALEEVTGKSIAELMREEITEPMALDTMRVKWESPLLPENPDRAALFKRTNQYTTHKDTSWKHLGGGMEASALDLARFGDLLLRDEMMPETVRKNRLFAPQDAGTTWGAAWSNGTVTTGTVTRNIVSHSGSGFGAWTNMRMYPDDGLTIVMMANRKQTRNLTCPVGVATCSHNGLLDRIGNAVFSNAP